jgi:hypothetical protein
MCCSQGLQEATEGRRKTIVGFVGRGPECVAASLWFSMNFENCIVRWDFFESDIGMPSVGGKR